MRRNRKIWTLLFGLILVVSSLGSECYATEADNTVLSAEYDAYGAYLSISDAFDIRMDQRSSDYPDDFGGCYIENGKLVILLTDDTQENQLKYREACGNSSVLDFRVVDYSYEYLLALADDIMPEMASMYEIYEYYVNVKENTVDIGVLDLESDPQVHSNYPITLYEMGTLPETTAMKGGEGITNSGTSLQCSICFFGTYNGKKALITCGHTNSVGRSIKYNGTVVGAVIKQNLKTYTDVDGIPSSYGDFSIVDISSSPVSGSNYVLTPNGTITATGTANLVVGLTVSMYGSQTKSVTGTVQNTGVTATFTDPEDYSTYKVKGLTTIGGTSFLAGGDSGGCAVYTTSAGVNRVAGCLTGVKSGICSYITPSSYIESSGFSFN